MIGRLLRSFRTRLMLLMLVAALPAFAAILYSSLWQRERAIAHAQAHAQEMARTLASEYREHIEQMRLYLAALNRIPGVADGRGADCAAQLDDMRRHGPYYIANLFAVAADGRMVCSAVALPAPLNVAERPYFRAALRTDGFRVSEFHLSPRSGKPTVILTHTVRRDGSIVAVLGAAIDLSRLSGHLLLRELPAGAAYALLDQHGKILLHYPDPDRHVGTPLDGHASWPALDWLRAAAASRATPPDGIERLFAHAAVGSADTPDAHVVVGLPEQTANAEAASLLLQGCLGLAVAGLLGLAIGWFGATRLVLRPMQPIFEAVRRLAAGHLTARTGSAGGGVTEIGQLAVEVDRMAETLAGRDLALRESLRRSRAQLRAIDAIAMSPALPGGDIAQLAREITELAARVVGVERANVWLFNADETELACIDGFEATPARHTAGAVLREDQFRNEFAALKDAPYVDADDPITDPRTAGYVATYLNPLGIASMLDAVIHISGRHIGVLCLEHVGRSHHWEPDEIAFACHLADKLALAHVHRERREAEAAARQAGERAQAYLDLVDVMVVALDRAGDITLANRKACEILSCAPDGCCVGANWFDHYVPAAGRDEAKTRFRGLMAGEIPFVERAVDHVLSTRGERRLIAWASTPVRDADGTLAGMLAAGEDVTERQLLQAEHERLQNQLQQAQKMEALGQLTGGIAHDFNNILASVLGFAKLALRRHVPDKDGELAEYLGEVVAAGERARDLVARMMAFSRSQPGTLSGAVAPLPVARESVKLLSATIPACIRIETRFDADLPEIVMDPVDFHQVLMNLVINARDAVGDKGRIAISLAGRQLDPTVCATCHERFGGDYLELTVGDDGAGIPAAALPRIFEPFFTTKDVGKGTGMGLSMVHGLVRRAGGHFQVDTAVGRGTVFHVFLPVARQPAAAPAPDVALPPRRVRPPRPDAPGRVLVVDDEVVIRELLVDVLADGGWQASAFDDPRAALAAVRQAPHTWLAAITDQTMPHMTGDELIVALHALRPDLPTILCTGYSDLIDADKARAIGADRFFYKPVDPEELLAALAELVTAAETAGQMDGQST